MGIFGKTSSLSGILKRIEAGAPFETGELDKLIDGIGEFPEFQIEENLWMFSHPSQKVREFAARQFECWGGQSLVDRLIKEMPGKPASIRQEIAKLVCGAGLNRVLANLGGLVHSKVTEQREAALDLIAEQDKWQDLLPYLKVTIRDPDPNVRRRTARIMARGLDNCNIFLILRELINDEDAALRHIIIEAFARRPSVEIVEPFFERLLIEGPDQRNTILKALTYLARTSQQQVEDRILPMLGDESAEIRDIAVKLFSEMPDRTRVLRSFLLHCRGLAFWLRERSIESIQKVSDNLTEPLMTLMRDEEDDVKVGAMLMASGSRDPRLIPLIRDIYLGSYDWWIRSMAAEALSRFQQEEVTDLLLGKLEDPELRYSIISVLGARKGEAPLRALLGCLADPKRGIRRAAIRALAQTRLPDAMTAITRIAESDPDESVREQAQEILCGFGDEGRQKVDALIHRRQKRDEQERAEILCELRMANEGLNIKS
jgi:HEAT repeat protein